MKTENWRCFLYFSVQRCEFTGIPGLANSEMRCERLIVPVTFCKLGLRAACKRHNEL